MNIVILTNEYPPHVYGGAGVHVEYLSKELARIGGGAHHVSVFAFGDLAFATARAEVGPEGHFLSRNIFVTSHFDGFYEITGLDHADDFVKMSGVKAEPFAAQVKGLFLDRSVQ